MMSSHIENKHFKEYSLFIKYYADKFEYKMYEYSYTCIKYMF